MTRPTGGFLCDETGARSSRRLMFFASGFSLCIALLSQALSPWEFTPDEHLIDALMWICLGSGGLASIDKLSARKYAKGEGAADA
jgi:hypothetical protein